MSIMLSDFVSHHAILNKSSDFPAENSVTIQKNSCDKQMGIEKKLNFKDDADFQSFLLPLEQDFTKSSKGYSSLFTAISDRELKSVAYTNKLERSEINKTVLNEKIPDTVYLRNTSDHNYTSNDDNLYYEKFTQLIRLENFENDQYDENKFSKIHIKAIHNPQNNNLVSEKDQNVVYLENCMKTTQDFSLNFTNLGRFNYKYDDNSSESYEADSSHNKYNNSVNFDDDSGSDDSIIFTEEVAKNKSCCSTLKIQQTFVMTHNSDQSESLNPDNCPESEENTFAFSPKDLEIGPTGFLGSFNASPPKLYDPTIALNSGYINAGFEDNDFLFGKSKILKDINESWNDSMKNISREPHESKKVAFVPMPDLVSIFSYEAENDNYRYSTYILDQIRFQNRIKDFESSFTPYLTPEHRASIYQRNFLLRQKPF